MRRIVLLARRTFHDAYIGGSARPESKPDLETTRFHPWWRKPGLGSGSSAVFQRVERSRSWAYQVAENPGVMAAKQW
jgi:hypothetical protein